MTVYVDMYFIVNFLLDLFSLIVCIRILGYRYRPLRLCIACTLGALYAVAVLRFTSPYLMLLHLCFGALMLLIACGFGNLRRFLRLCLMFFGVCFLTGGVITALGRGIVTFYSTRSRAHLVFSVILVCAATGALLCLFWGKVAPIRPGKRTADVKVAYGNRSLSFQAYADTGNALRDPLENTPVILANAALSRRVYALFSDAALPSRRWVDPSFFDGMPLRLIPCATATSKTVLPALKFSDAMIEGEKRPVCIALDLTRKGEYCGFEALLPAAVL